MKIIINVGLAFSKKMETNILDANIFVGPKVDSIWVG